MDLTDIAREIVMRNASLRGGLPIGGLSIAGRKKMPKKVKKAPKKMASMMCRMCPAVQPVHMAGRKKKVDDSTMPKKKRKINPKLRAWIDMVKAYQQQTGMSYKDSLKALKGTKM
jgi:hypothetical protein